MKTLDGEKEGELHNVLGVVKVLETININDCSLRLPVMVKRRNENRITLFPSLLVAYLKINNVTAILS